MGEVAGPGFPVGVVGTNGPPEVTCWEGAGGATAGGDEAGALAGGGVAGPPAGVRVAAGRAVLVASATAGPLAAGVPSEEPGVAGWLATPIARTAANAAVTVTVRAGPPRRWRLESASRGRRGRSGGVAVARVTTEVQGVAEAR